MTFDPVPFDPPAGNPVGRFTAQLSPDGWEDSMYENTPHMHLSSAEVMECARFINSFMRECNTQDQFMKYVKKHGDPIDKVTSVLFCRGDRLSYVLSVSGYSLSVNVHRKENA